MRKIISTGILLVSCLANIQTVLGNVVLGTVTNNTDKNIAFITVAGEPFERIKAGETKNFNVPIPVVQMPQFGIGVQMRRLIIRIPSDPQIEPLTFNFVRNAETNPQFGTTTLNNVASLQRGQQPVDATWFGPAQPHNILHPEQEDDYRIDVVLEGDNLQNSQFEVTTSIIG